MKLKIKGQLHGGITVMLAGLMMVAKGGLAMAQWRAKRMPSVMKKCPEK